MSSKRSRNRTSRQGGTRRLIPHWDQETRELRWQGKVIKRLVRQAEVQSQILEAFQRAGWPRTIRDPLPADGIVPPAQRLRDAVKNLNRRLEADTIRFHTNGCGNGIEWHPLNGNSIRRPVPPGVE